LEPSWKNAVSLDFWTYADAGHRQVGERFLSSLFKAGFVPNRYGDDDPPSLKFGEFSSMDDILELWAKRPKQMSVQRLGNLGFQAVLHLTSEVSRPHLASLAVHDKYFEKPANTEKFLGFASLLYDILRPAQGDIGHQEDRRNKTVIQRTLKIGRRTVEAEEHPALNPTLGLSGIYWANFFGPAYVDFFSQDLIQSAPALSKKKLSDGGYLLTTAKSPLDYQSPETKKTEQALIDHLGRAAFFDKNMPERILRSPFPRGDDLSKSLRRPSFFLRESGSVQGQLRNCPECGETTKIREMSRDSLNQLIGFKCLECGAMWAVQASLLKSQ